MGHKSRDKAGQDTFPIL